MLRAKRGVGRDEITGSNSDGEKISTDKGKNSSEKGRGKNSNGEVFFGEKKSSDKGTDKGKIVMLWGKIGGIRIGKRGK